MADDEQSQAIVARPAAPAPEDSQPRQIFGVNTTCIVCKKAVRGWFIALDAPYHGLCHAKCQLWLPMDEQWPHECIASAYKNLDE